MLIINTTDQEVKKAFIFGKKVILTVNFRDIFVMGVCGICKQIMYLGSIIILMLIFKRRMLTLV